MAAPTVSATSSSAKALEHLINLVASSATFQTLTGAADATAAKAFIDVLEAVDERDEEVDADVDDPETIVSTRPRAIVDTAESNEVEDLGLREPLHRGTAMVVLELEIPVAYRLDADDTTAEKKQKRADALMWFEEKTGAILDELLANSGLSDGSNLYMNIRRVRDLGPVEMPQPDDGSTWGTRGWLIDWM